MAQIRVRITDTTGNETITAEIPGDVNMTRLIPALLTKLNRPIIGSDGAPIAYELFNAKVGRVIAPHETLEEARLVDGDTLIIRSTQVSSEEIVRQERLQERIRITAPVEIPTAEQMTVKLVPAHLLSRLEEARADESRWTSVGWAFIGSSLGVVTNWVTSEQTIVTRASLAVIVTFVIVSALAFVAARQFSRRASNVREEMLSGGMRPAASSHSA